jgi:O-antigen/teichoic acid export membrane protein
VRSFKISLSRQDNAQYIRWARKGTLAVMDQGIFSGSNFVVSVLLARWMSESDYGAYSIAFSIFLLISGFYNVLLLEPMSIFGPVRYANHFGEYLNQLIRLHVVGALISAVVLTSFAGLASMYASDTALVSAFVGLGLAHGLTLFFWLSRQACYVKHDTWKALTGTISYSITMIGGSLYLETADLLTPLSVFIAMGFAGMLAGLLLYWVQFNSEETEVRPGDFSIRAIASEHWSYGRWMIIASVSSWLSMWAYFVLAGSMLSLEEVAGLKAIQNLVLPITQIITAFMLLFAPWASQRFSHHGLPALKDAMQTYSLLLASMGITYFFVLWVFKGPVLDSLYGGKFTHLEWMVLPFLLQPLIIAMTVSWIYGLRIIGRTRDVMIIYVIGGTTTITMGALLVNLWGLKGAIAGILLSSLAPLPVLVSVWRKVDGN